MSASSATTSISPVSRSGFSRPDGRRRTTPVTFTTYSALKSRAAVCALAELSGSKTTWVMPHRSRRSMNTSPPWSRRRCTQPANVTRWPASSDRSWPQVCVLSVIASYLSLLQIRLLYPLCIESQVVVVYVLLPNATGQIAYCQWRGLMLG